MSIWILKDMFLTDLILESGYKNLNLSIEVIIVCTNITSLGAIFIYTHYGRCWDLRYEDRDIITISTTNED